MGKLNIKKIEKYYIMKNENIVSFKKAALVSNVVEEHRLLNMDLEDLYGGFFAVQVQVAGKVLEVRVQVLSDGDSRLAYGAASLDEVVDCFAHLGRSVMIPVIGDEGSDRGDECVTNDAEDFDERVARRMGELDITEQLELLELLDGYVSQGDRVAAMAAAGDFAGKESV